MCSSGAGAQGVVHKDVNTYDVVVGCRARGLGLEKDQKKKKDMKFCQLSALIFLAITTFQASLSEAPPTERWEGIHLAFLFDFSSALLVRLGLFTGECWLRKWECNGGVTRKFPAQQELVVLLPTKSLVDPSCLQQLERKSLLEGFSLLFAGSHSLHQQGASTNTAEVEMSSFIGCSQMGCCLPDRHIICEEIHRYKVSLTNFLCNFKN